MRRAAVIAVVGVAALIAWRRCQPEPTAPPPHASAVVRAQSRVDPAAVARGTIAGTVRDRAGLFAGALVCVTASSRELDAQAVRDLPCVTAGAGGEYRIAALLPTRYVVSASAPQHEPATRTIDVAGDMKVDLALARGGVELGGVVSDLVGGPIAHARVLAGPAITETADDGTFSVSVAPGPIEIIASADGYAPARENTTAPRHVELQLVPEGIVTGTVIDARTKAPVEGARVTASVGDATLTDARGAFRITRLPAGAMDLVATSPTGYGRTAGSVVVGVGVTTAGIVIELHPAVTVTGHVMLDKAPCAAASVELTEVAKAREVVLEARGETVVAEGVLPGTYRVEVHCEGAIAREPYPSLVVGTEPVDATWHVDRGGRIEGRVTTRAGAPVARFSIYVGARPDAAWWWRTATTDADGRYRIDGVPPGTVLVGRSGMTAREARAEVAVPRDGVATHDVVVDEVGRVRGVVRDEAGTPLAGYYVAAKPDTDLEAFLGETSDARGAYLIDDVPPGTYRLVVSHPAQRDLARATVTVTANQIAERDITVKRPRGAITGIVLDGAKRPVSDAFVKIARETENLLGVWDELRGDRGERTMTDTEGRFVLRDLPDGAYTVRAFRPAGPEVFAEHVAPEASLVLQLRSTGELAGTVRSWGSTLDDLRIQIVEERTGYRRSEMFFRTGGAFVLENLPPGHYELAAGAEGQETRIEIDLAEGERKQGLEIALVPLVTLTGRVVDHLTRAPAAAIHVSVFRPGASTRFSATLPSTSDAGGRFTITNVPVGDVVVHCRGRGTHETLSPRRTRGTGTVDIGDVPVMRERGHEMSGESGLELAEPTFGPDEKAVVESVTPGGPAANAGIIAGDVITSIDGVDTRGYGSFNAWNALVAPPGTTLAITLARGVIVDVVLSRR